MPEQGQGAAERIPEFTFVYGGFEVFGRYLIGFEEWKIFASNLELRKKSTQRYLFIAPCIQLVAQDMDTDEKTQGKGIKQR